MSGRSGRPDVVTVEYTLHMAKYLHKEKRAPKAVRRIKKFVTSNLGTKDVRIDPGLNRFLWSRGIKNVPKRVRIRCERKRNEDEEAKEKLYTHVTYVEVPSFKGLVTETISE